MDRALARSSRPKSNMPPRGAPTLEKAGSLGWGWVSVPTRVPERIGPMKSLVSEKWSDLLSPCGSAPIRDIRPSAGEAMAAELRAVKGPSTSVGTTRGYPYCFVISSARVATIPSG